MGGCQKYGPFLGTLNNRCRIIIGYPKGDPNFDNHPYDIYTLADLFRHLGPMLWDLSGHRTNVVVLFLSSGPLLWDFFGHSDHCYGTFSVAGKVPGHWGTNVMGLFRSWGTFSFICTNVVGLFRSFR